MTQEELYNLLLSIIPNARETKDNHIRGGCPICGEEDKFYINYEKALEKNSEGKFEGSFICFKGGHQGSLFTLLRETGNLDKLSFERTISDNRSDFKIVELSTEQPNNTDQYQILSEEVKFPFSAKRVPTNNFLSNRGWSQREFNKYDIYQSKNNDYVFIGIKQAGKTVAYLGRSLKSAESIKEHNKKVKETGDGFEIQKFRNSWGVDFAKIVGGLDDISPKTHTLIVTEGIFDKEAVDRKLNLDGCDVVKCVFTFGKSFKDYQVNIIKKFTNVNNIIILYDADAIASSIKVAKSIQNSFRSVRIATLDDCDPDEADTEQLKESLRSSRNPEQFFTVVDLWD